MTDYGQDKVAAFDTLFTNNKIQKLKILMPYFDRTTQKNIAIYIKYMELQYTLSFFNSSTTKSALFIPVEKNLNFEKLCSEIIPYSNRDEKTKLENIKNMFKTFESYKDMIETFQMMKELFPEGDNPMNMDLMNSMDFMNSFAGMSGMGDMSGFNSEQLFSLLKAMSFSNEPVNSESTDTVNERNDSNTSTNPENAWNSSNMSSNTENTWSSSNMSSNISSNPGNEWNSSNMSSKQNAEYNIGRSM